MTKYLNKVGVIILMLTISLITACGDDTPNEIPNVQATIDAAIELGIEKIPTPTPLPTPIPTPLPTPTPTPLPTPTPTPLPTPTPTPLPTPTPTPLPTPTPTPLPTPTPTPLPTPTPTPLPIPTPTPLPTNEPKLKSFSITNSNLSRDLAVNIAFSSSLEGANDVRVRFKNVSNPNRGLYTQSCFVFTNLSGNTSCTIKFSASGDFWTENGKYTVEEIEIKSPNSIVSQYKPNGTVIPDTNYLTLGTTTHDIQIYSLNLNGAGFSIATEKIYIKSLHFNNDIYRRSGLSNGDTFDLLVKFSSNVLVTSKEYDATGDTTNKAYIIFSLKNISDSNESGKLYMLYHSGSGTNELTFRGIIPTTTKQGLITPNSNNQAIETNGTALIKNAIPGTFIPLTGMDLLFANQGPSRVENIFSDTSTKTYSTDKVLTTYTYKNFAINALSQVSTKGQD
jgi:hypothetical protein